MKYILFIALLMIVMFSMPARIFAADTPAYGAIGGASTTNTTQATSTGSASTGSGCQTIVDLANKNMQWLMGILVLLAGTPFKVAAGISVVVGIIAWFSDSGHLSHIAKSVLGVVMAVMITGVLLGFILSPNSTFVTC